MKSRGCYETPGGTVILEALRTLRSVTMERDTARMAEKLAIDYADIVYTGRWYHPLRRSLDAFFRETTRYVTGHVRVELFKGRRDIDRRRLADIRCTPRTSRPSARQPTSIRRTARAS
jgi:argininosuccinate synthase